VTAISCTVSWCEATGHQVERNKIHHHRQVGTFGQVSVRIVWAERLDGVPEVDPHIQVCHQGLGDAIDLLAMEARLFAATCSAVAPSEAARFALALLNAADLLETPQGDPA
jgi:hypothetical protein